MIIHTKFQRPKDLDKTYELAGLTKEGDALSADETARLGRPTLSIIVPTRNEAGNVEKLVTGLEQALPNTALEVIFVDDSTDDTPQVIQEVSERFPFDITLIARPPERRNGLGMAVVEGMRAARSEWVCVMDGDLQHPPDVIPQLLDQAQSGESDLVMGSRLVKG
jgi:dolichol-phosphate mannosyltransferase